MTRRSWTGCTHARFGQRLHAPAPEPAQRKPFLSQAGEGESVWSLGGRFTAKATAAVTEGRFALVEWVAFQSTEPPLHIHHREEKAWYILDGKMTFCVGDAVIEATAGCFAFAPRGIPHTFIVDVEPTRVLVFASPAGFEHFALKRGEQARDDTPPAGLAVPGPEVLGPVAERYGIEVAGPPPGPANGTIWLLGAGRVTWGRQAISHAAQGLQICPPRAARQAGRGTAPKWRQCAPDS